jgi:hypothetical protein
MHASHLAGAGFAVVLPSSKVLAEMDPRPQANFEPAPIDLPAETIALARDLLAELRAGTIDRSRFEPQMNAFLTAEKLHSGANHLRPYGDPLTFTPVELRTTAEGIAALFRVRFATETLTWWVRVSPEG